MEKLKSDRYLLFDFDGTINNMGDLIYSRAAEVIEELGLEPIDKQKIENYRGMALRPVLKDLGIPKYKIPLFLKKVRASYKTHREEVKVNPGLEKVLRDVKNSGYRIGILTSNDVENVVHLLDKYELTELFDDIQSESSLWGKDRAIKKYIKDKDVNLEDIVYIGDEVRDIEACKKVDVSVIAVTWGINNREILSKFSPDYLLDEVDDFNKVLDLKGSD